MPVEVYSYTCKICPNVASIPIQITFCLYFWADVLVSIIHFRYDCYFLSTFLDTKVQCSRVILYGCARN